MTWNILTVILFYFGPLHFNINQNYKLFLYLVVALFSIIFGYIRGIKSTKTSKSLSNSRAMYIISIAFYISLLSLIYNIILNPVSFSDISFALDDPYAARELENIKNINYLGLFTAPFNLLFLIIVPAYWNKLHSSKRVFWIILVVWMIVGSVVNMQRHGIFALIIFILFSTYAGNISGLIKIPVKKAFIFSLVSLSLFIIFSEFVTLNRQFKPKPLIQTFSSRGDLEFNDEHLFFQMSKGFLENTIISSIYYFTHGYVYLSESINLPFNGVSFPVGHSRFLTRNSDRVTSSNFFHSKSYFFRLQSERNMLQTKWITFYPWVASDVTFIGSFFIIFVLFRLFGALVVDIKRSKNVYAIVLFVMIGYQFMSLPQGSVLQDGEMVWPFYLFLFLWLKNRNQKLVGN